MITDRMRHTIIEVNTNKILTRDLTATEVQLQMNLSSPARISFKVPQSQRYDSAYGINWKNWGQWIITEIEIDGEQRILSCCVVNQAKLDPKGGDLIVEGIGFMGYPKGIPWLENFNPIAVDPAEIIQRIWAHVQSYPNANMEVEVQPSSTGTQMLPGYGYDGNILSFDFFAIFVRAVDFIDCGDYISSLARDLPLDLFEECVWNDDRTKVKKVLRIAYPMGGLQQDFLAFRLDENVINAEKAEELDIEPVSDVIIRSWMPGKVYSSQISNADQTRLRRTILEEDANIDSTERAAAWAKRKLYRRNVPLYFSKIVVDANHPHAPFGKYGLGDSIFVEAPNFPWYGEIRQWHRITSITMNDGNPQIELGLKVDGAFNYDPIDYDPDWVQEPTKDLNMLSNGYFKLSLAGWYMRKGQWIRMAIQGYKTDGCVRIDCDDRGEELESEKVVVAEGDIVNFSAWVRFQTITVSGTPSYTFGIATNTYNSGGAISKKNLIGSFYEIGTGGYKEIRGSYTVPMGVDEVSISLIVNDSVTSGIAFWDDVRIEK